MRRRLIMAAVPAALGAGVVVGIGFAAGWFSSSAAASWRVRDLGAPHPIASAVPVAINDRGVIVASDGSGSIFLRGRWIDLGSLGGASTAPAAINDRGEIVGQSDTAAGRHHAFLWRKGQMLDLGVSRGESNAVAINNRGQIVGNIYVGNKQHAFLWYRGNKTDLGTLGGDSSTAAGLNDRGQVIGYSTTSGGNQRGFLWERGRMIDLGTLPHRLFPADVAEHVEPIDINESGEIVGLVRDDIGSYARWFLWRDGRMSTRVATYNWENPVAINRPGQVVVETSRDADAASAFLWQNRTLTRLPTLGGPAIWATDLNDKGQVVGRSFVIPGRTDHMRPFVWENGELTALDWLDQRDGPPWGSITAINNRGEIIGYQYVEVGGHNEQHIVLWTKDDR